MSITPTTPADSTLTGAYAGADLAPGTLLADRYRIEALLGIGGMGVVYRATDQALGVPVAVKLLRPELAQRSEAFERFRQELLLARQVSNPHVVRIHDIARDGTRWFITMDLIDGEALDRLIDRDGALPVDQALAIARQLAEGLGAAHARGVVHRDLKPSNVLIDREGRACIADFGVARSLGTSGLTHSGAIIGTPDYLSPEQARGAPVDARSDLYALGLLLYEMLTGKLAFNASTASESLSQRLVGTPPPLRRARSDAPAWVERIVGRLLRLAPAHRFQSAAEVIAAIDARRAPTDWFAWRRRAVVALGASALIAAVVAIWVWPRPPAAPAAPAAPPPQRILVLTAVDGDTSAEEAFVLEALADHARLALQASSNLAAIDAERTRQALAVMVLPHGGVPKDEALRTELPGTRVLRLGFSAEEPPRLRAWLRAQGEDRALATTAGSDHAAALLQALRALAPEMAMPAGVLPSDQAALLPYGEALALRAQGRIEEAQARYATALQIAPDYSAADLALAEAAWIAGNAAAAREAIERPSAQAAGALQSSFLSLSALLDGDTEIATKALGARLAVAPDDLATVLRLAYVEGENGDFAAAMQRLRELVRRDPGEARAWFLLGKYAILRGDVRAAVDEYLVRALVLFKRGRSVYGESETVNALGVGYARLGQMQDADEQYRKAVDLRRAIGNRRGVASSLRNLAQLATVRGEHDQAAQQLAEARDLFEAVEDRGGLAAIDNELGLLAEERGNYAEALEAYRRALRGREALDDVLGAAESLNNIGFSHYQLGDYDSAQVFWRQAEDAFVAQEDLNGSTRTRQNLGLLQIARGRWTQARRLLQESLDTAERQQLVEEAAVSRRNLAELDILQGRYSAAQDQLARAEALFTERDDRRGLVDAVLLRARLLLNAYDAEAARAALHDAASRLEEASTEQRAIAALLRAEVALAIGEKTDSALSEADALAKQTGVFAQMLAVRILREPRAADLDDALRKLGNRLLWLRRQDEALRRELDENAVSAAVARYREVSTALQESGEYAHAWRLHRLGARALRAAGDHDAATQADAAAEREIARLLTAAPVSLHAALQRETGRDVD